jgi:RNA polymerase sigma-70 factor (ECF subfamily)
MYAYVRRSGHPPDGAKDLTQGFFSHLLEKGSVASADPERGRFRTFLLSSLKNYLVDQRRRETAQKRGGGRILEPLQSEKSEQQYQFEPADQASPDVLYDRGWARAVLGQALTRLKEEYTASKHGPGFQSLKDYVWGDRSGTSCVDLGRELGLSEEAAKKAVQRLRRRFAEILREQIAETVNTPAEVQEELRYLFGLLE